MSEFHRKNLSKYFGEDEKKIKDICASNIKNTTEATFDDDESSNNSTEQSTDYIFCTIGEEWGLIGTSLVIFLFIALIFRIVQKAEMQRSKMSRVYGYCVASIFFIHFLINIGMTIQIA